MCLMPVLSKYLLSLDVTTKIVEYVPMIVSRVKIVVANMEYAANLHD